MDTIHLIDIEGFDRVGKDTLLNNLSNLPGLEIYRQPPVESFGVDYRDTKRFEPILREHFKKVISDLQKFDGSKPVILSRFLLSDNVYSHMFIRERILEQEFNKVKDKFKLTTVLLLWDSFNDYVERVKASGSVLEYEEDEFKYIQHYFERYLEGDYAILNVKHSDTEQDVFNRFLNLHLI